MEIIDIILRLIKTMALVSTEDYQQLVRDVEEWKSAKVEESDKIKILYMKIHKGIYVRLLAPFGYFFLLNWVRNLTAPPSDDLLD